MAKSTSKMSIVWGWEREL